jgi:hypothetical protein
MLRRQTSLFQFFNKTTTPPAASTQSIITTTSATLTAKPNETAVLTTSKDHEVIDLLSDSEDDASDSRPRLSTPNTAATTTTTTTTTATTATTRVVSPSNSSSGDLPVGQNHPSLSKRASSSLNGSKEANKRVKLETPTNTKTTKDAEKDDDDDDEVLVLSAVEASISFRTCAALSSSSNIVTQESNNNEEEEIEIVGSTGHNALADFPHSREMCVTYPLSNKAIPPSQHCPNCYCYVCDDKAATCHSWHTHCRAKVKDFYWQMERRLERRRRKENKEQQVEQATRIVTPHQQQQQQQQQHVLQTRQVTARPTRPPPIANNPAASAASASAALPPFGGSSMPRGAAQMNVRSVQQQQRQNQASMSPLLPMYIYLPPGPLGATIQGTTTGRCVVVACQAFSLLKVGDVFEALDGKLFPLNNMSEWVALLKNNPLKPSRQLRIFRC